MSGSEHTNIRISPDMSYFRFTFKCETLKKYRYVNVPASRSGTLRNSCAHSKMTKVEISVVNYNFRNNRDVMLSADYSRYYTFKK